MAEGSNAGSLELRHCVRFSSRKKEYFFLHQLRPSLRRLGDISGLLVSWAILNSLVLLGARVSVIAPLPERLPGLIEGSLQPQSSFEYMCLVVNSL